MLLVILTVKKLLEGFTKKNCSKKKHIKQNLELRKESRENVINSMSNGNVR